MRALGDFIDRLSDSRDAGPEFVRHRAIGVVATAGDRRDDDMREMGEVAAQHFDTIIVREDRNLRGRSPGETAGLVAEGVRAAMADSARCRSVESVLDELESVRAALEIANPGDVVVICVDSHSDVVEELERRAREAR
jgi:cyanophycin synthetase